MISSVLWGGVILIAIYLIIAQKLISDAGKEVKKYRAELKALYLRRVNLMPRLMDSARRHSPVPLFIYNAFIDARQRFAGAATDTETASANGRLTAVFDEFFANYADYANPRFENLRVEYLGIMEKIAFTSNFLSNAGARYNRLVTTMPYRPAQNVLILMDSSYKSAKKLVKQATAKILEAIEKLKRA